MKGDATLLFLVRGEETPSHSLSEKPARGEETLFLLLAIGEAYSPHEASPRLLLPMSDGLGSLRESSVGSLGSPFSSPSPSIDIARQLVATVEIDRYWPILGDNEVKQPQSVVTPGSGWSVYRFVGGPVHIPLYGRYLSIL
ncbi:hypothetical protein BHE74_00034480 [Ensete ventricosum]|nr:hypothetical protein BHE74_00034480 [Ensete ventricosum]